MVDREGGEGCDDAWSSLKLVISKRDKEKGAEKKKGAGNLIRSVSK